MSDIVCAICYEKFVRDVNPPITCVPCGHTMCKPCLNHWFGNPATNTHGSGSHNLVGGNTGHLNQPTGFAAIFGGARPNGRQNTCPQCRQQCQQTLFNFALMDSLEKSPGYHNMVTPRPAHDANIDPVVAPPADSLNTNQAFIVAGSAMPSAPIEGGGATLDMVNPVANPFAGVESGSDPVHRSRNAEILLDKSEVAIYVIDNSGSMQQNDGKIFQMIPDPSYPGKQKCVKQGYGSVTRWKEAGHKTMQIANYNVERKMRGVYYLLNPQRHANWVDNVDYVYIDPSAQDAGTVASKLNALQNNILAERSIRGSTPLDNVTSHVRSVLTSSSPGGNRNSSSWFTGSGSNNTGGMSLPGLTDVLTAGGHGSGEGGFNKIPICYNIITDGEPNDKYAFEREIKALANEKNFSLFLTVNLCTDDDDIVDYYNDLDQKLGNELSGMDVLDDLEAEQGEVFQQNKFFHYCNEIHVARMAGCNSVIADLMDEESMEAFYAVKVVKELLGLAGNEDSKWHSVDTSPQALEISALRKETGQTLPMWSDDEQFEAFIGAVNKMNREVYDFRLRRYEKVVDMYHFRRLVSAFRKRENWVRWFDERRTGPVSNFFCKLGLKTVKVWCV